MNFFPESERRDSDRRSSERHEARPCGKRGIGSPEDRKSRHFCSRPPLPCGLPCGGLLRPHCRCLEEGGIQAFAPRAKAETWNAFLTYFVPAEALERQSSGQSMRIVCPTWFLRARAPAARIWIETESERNGIYIYIY